MGAWGVGVFDNDSAADWIYELEGSSGEGLLHETLSSALTSDYLDADLGSSALAAAALVAALGGQVLPDLSPEAQAWVSAQQARPSAGLIALAKQAVQRVLGPDSELHQLWQESEELLAWKQSTEALIDALDNAASA